MLKIVTVVLSKFDSIREFCSQNSVAEPRLTESLVQYESPIWGCALTAPVIERNRNHKATTQPRAPNAILDVHRRLGSLKTATQLDRLGLLKITTLVIRKSIP